MNYPLIASLLLAAVSAHAVESEAILNERLKSADPTSVEGVDGWRFLPAEIRHLLAGDPSNDSKKPLDTIVDFNRQLKQLGVRLIVVPVPAKVTIHSEFFDKRLAGVAASSSPEAAFFEALRAKGVEVLDLTQEFADAKAEGPLYCARDSHWNGRAIALAAKQLAAELKGGLQNKVELEAREEQIEIQGDLGGAKEKVTLRFINPKGQTARLEPDRASPILIMGDSYVLVFHDGGDMHASGAGLPDQLAYEMNGPVDVLGVRGSGATPARVSLARRARANLNYLRDKKVVIWCFGVRELTQAETWKPIPLLKTQAPAQ
jgi:SGNH hydrolase-like domain, acetyltransferase AlgX